jgi:hypothetical protein
MVNLALRALRGPREQATGLASAFDRIEHLYRARERAGGQHLRVEQVAAEVGANPRYVASTLYVLRALDRDGPAPRAQWAANRQRAAALGDLDQLARQRRQAERGIEGDWRAKAACAAPTVDPELFFPEAGEGWKAVQAKQVCSGCSVRTSCLHEALTGPQAQGEDVYGIFGGTSQAERRRLRGQHLPATPPCSTGTASRPPTRSRWPVRSASSRRPGSSGCPLRRCTTPGTTTSSAVPTATVAARRQCS